ncbi:major facilitator superfamily domain-containing protein 4A [Biomphalaria pfeifferi]|uniref:Major facilitator superfamily domain-containing protein 4A n=1 Tax=Biomphalaria pfeifferi TaxID=112525 RepID=A0AAD8FH01_BIOPF|nr:major facilitator superfamily domain-containing protein 4A [Biomphalaria pfeifferi]
MNFSGASDMSNGAATIDAEPIKHILEKEIKMDDGQWLEQTTISTRDDAVSFWKLFLDNWIYVVTYCSVFGSFGVCVGFLGPTVFDLGCQTHSDLKQMNWVFFVQLIMTLVGSITAGCLADR